jgi:hypothetical protein
VVRWQKTALLQFLVVGRLVRFANVLFVRGLPQLSHRAEARWQKLIFSCTKFQLLLFLIRLLTQFISQIIKVLLSF